jgi:hypothetical protein
LDESELLHAMARELRNGSRANLNFDDYFKVVAAFPAYVLERCTAFATRTLGDRHYALVFTTAALARPHVDRS